MEQDDDEITSRYNRAPSVLTIEGLMAEVAELQEHLARKHESANLTMREREIAKLFEGLSPSDTRMVLELARRLRVGGDH